MLRKKILTLLVQRLELFLLQKFENFIPDVTGLVTKTDYDTKISGIQKKYFTAADHNRFESEILDVKTKQEELVSKSDISNLVKSSYQNIKLRPLATKSDLNAEQDKIVKLQTHDLTFFLAKKVFGDDGLQNMFVYQPTDDTLK